MKVHLFFILLRLKVYTNVRNIPYLVRRNGCIVHFLRISSFVTHGIESVGVDARSIQSQLRLFNAQPARENMGIGLRVISM